MRFTVNDASQSAAAEVDTNQAGLYSILLPRHCHCGCIPQSLRWRVLDLRTGEAQAADLGYVVGCTVVTREAEEDWRKRNGDNAGQEPICVRHGRTGYFADRRASSSRSMQKSEEHL